MRLQLGLRLLRGALQGLGVVALLDLLHLLLGLPEEEVGADGGAEDRHHHGHVGRRVADLRDHQALGHLAPGHLHHEGHAHIGEQRQRQPLQDRDVAGIAGEDLQEHGDQAEGGHVEQLVAADQQPQARAHGAQVRADVDDVGHHQQSDDRIDHRVGVVLLQVAGDAAAGHPADAGADLLDGAHQGPGDHHHPGEAKAELGAGLGIGGDAGGIVVRGAGDQARAQHLQQLGFLGLLDLVFPARRKLRLTDVVHGNPALEGPDANAARPAKLRLFREGREPSALAYFTVKAKLPSVSWPSSVFMCHFTL